MTDKTKKYSELGDREPIRVLQVLTIMNRGGAEAMIMNYYRNIDRTQVQFDFMLHREEEGAYDEEIRKLGGRIFIMPSIHPFKYKTYVRQLRDFFTEHPEYQIIHSHLNALSFIVLGMAKKLNVPIRISHSHTAVASNAIFKVFNKDSEKSIIVKDYIQHLLRRKVRRVASHYFACGQKAGEWLFGKENSTSFQIINNAIDTKPFQFDEQLSLEIKRKLGLTDQKIVGHIGRFNEYKNHLFLIEIFKELASLKPDYHLLLIGDGHLRAKTEKLVEAYDLKDRVTFLGVREDISALLQAIDLFVFPSLYEGLPVTLVEAQAAGIRIFASDRVTTEVDITGLVDFIGLELPAVMWAKSIDENSRYQRINTRDKVIKGGYDIKANVVDLQQFYLEHSKE